MRPPISLGSLYGEVIFRLQRPKKFNRSFQLSSFFQKRSSKSPSCPVAPFRRRALSITLCALLGLSPLTIFEIRHCPHFPSGRGMALSGAEIKLKKSGKQLHLCNINYFKLTRTPAKQPLSKRLTSSTSMARTNIAVGI